jgi:hypothetical protein
LSTGQRFLVCTTTADTGGGRSPLTLALGRPGETTFSKVFLIRRSVFPEGPGVSDPKADFSYPYAVEHEGKLYVVHPQEPRGERTVRDPRWQSGDRPVRMAVGDGLFEPKTDGVTGTRAPGLAWPRGLPDRPALPMAECPHAYAKSNRAACV